VEAAQIALPAIFWEVILQLLALLAGFSLLGEARGGNALALAGQGFGLALLIGLLFVLDFPFYGEVAVSPQPIFQALAAVQAHTDLARDVETSDLGRWARCPKTRLAVGLDGRVHGTAGRGKALGANLKGRIVGLVRTRLQWGSDRPFQTSRRVDTKGGTKL